MVIYVLALLIPKVYKQSLTWACYCKYALLTVRSCPVSESGKKKHVLSSLATQMTLQLLLFSACGNVPPLELIPANRINHRKKIQHFLSIQGIPCNLIMKLSFCADWAPSRTSSGIDRSSSSEWEMSALRSMCGSLFKSKSTSATFILPDNGCH